MVKLIGWIAVTWFLFHFGIAQALLLWTAGVGGWIAVTWFLFHFGIAQALLLWTAGVGTVLFG